MSRTVTYSHRAGNAQRVNCKASSGERARPSSGRTYAREQAQRNNKEPEPETDGNWEFVRAVSSEIQRVGFSSLYLAALMRFASVSLQYCVTVSGLHKGVPTLRVRWRARRLRRQAVTN